MASARGRERVRVFVSHHHSPAEDYFTARLVADLAAAGADVWVDNQAITSDDFVQKISDGLAGRQWLVLMMTPDSVQSRWVQREVSAALNEQTAGRMLGVIPFVMTPTPEQDIPTLWRTLLRYDATRGYEPARDRLLQTLAGLRPPDTELPSRSERTPFRSTPWSATGVRVPPSRLSWRMPSTTPFQRLSLVLGTALAVVVVLALAWRGVLLNNSGARNGNLSHTPTVTPLSGRFTEFMIPTASSYPAFLAAGPDGALWFSESSSSKLGRITTEGKITEFPIPVASEVPGITAGPDGALWFTELGRNKIGRLTTSGKYTDFAVPTGGSGPRYIAAGPDGALWFTEINGDNIARISTNGQIVEFHVPKANSNPSGIVEGPDGAVWFNEISGNQIGRLS